MSTILEKFKSGHDKFKAFMADVSERFSDENILAGIKESFTKPIDTTYGCGGDDYSDVSEYQSHRRVIEGHLGKSPIDLDAPVTPGQIASLHEMREAALLAPLVVGGIRRSAARENLYSKDSDGIPTGIATVSSVGAFAASCIKDAYIEERKPDFDLVEASLSNIGKNR
jgi:hypothetical protein